MRWRVWLPSESARTGESGESGLANSVTRFRCKIFLPYLHQGQTCLKKVLTQCRLNFAAAETQRVNDVDGLPFGQKQRARGETA